MREQGYTAAELRLVRRVLEDMELGRWPSRAERPAALDEPATVAAVWRVGEVVRAVEARVNAERRGVAEVIEFAAEDSAA